MPNGIVIIDKPADWTSMDVCAKLRGILQERRVGHAGTLDPMATGVLPVFVGRATRGVEFAAEGDKEYIAGLRLGLVTNTQDTTGEVLERHPVAVTAAELEAVLSDFRGDILQLPPMFSAIKINGQKLCNLARKGREVARAPRPVTIHRLNLEGMDGSDFILRIQCTKGTYVRTLCHDIGQRLGCGGVMSSLRRTAAAGFTLAQAVTLDALRQSRDPAALLRGIDTLFQAHPALTLTEQDTWRLKNGQSTPSPNTPEGRYRVYAPSSREFLALGQVQKGRLSVIKSFFDPSTPAPNNE